MNDHSYLSPSESRLKPFLKAAELASRWNKIYPSPLNTYEKLKKLGFTYIKDKIFIIPLVR